SPDIIVLTGDIYDDIADNKNTSLFLENIGKRYTCFYIAGNHEHRTDMWKKEYKAQAEGFGIRVLEGENVKIGEITVCGAARAADGSFTAEEAVGKCAKKTEGFSVLLCHFPENIDFYRSFGSFDLIMCGHAHGGQWRIPGVLNGLYAPGEGLFPKYAGGRYDFEDSVMIVSRGLAREYVLVPRIFNNPEVVVCDILPENR
ncbi:MAG: metallophosphoesterase, partial [Huintestinicola sp.]